MLSVIDNVILVAYRIHLKISINHGLRPVPHVNIFLIFFGSYNLLAVKSVRCLQTFSVLHLITNYHILIYKKTICTINGSSNRVPKRKFIHSKLLTARRRTTPDLTTRRKHCIHYIQQCKCSVLLSQFIE